MNDSVAPLEQKTMTVRELLDSLPEEVRDDMADFLYSRVPCRFMLRAEDFSPETLPNPVVIDAIDTARA